MDVLTKLHESISTTLVDLFRKRYKYISCHQILERLNQLWERIFRFKGLHGFINCCHFKWSQCPKALNGTHKGYKGYPRLILEAVADSNYRFIYHNFPIPGTYNDLTIFRSSQVSRMMFNGEIECNYVPQLLSRTTHSRKLLLLSHLQILPPLPKVLIANQTTNAIDNSLVFFCCTL